MRKEKHSRKTNETDISVQMNVDGSGVSEIDTGIDFFNHMWFRNSHFSNF